MASAINFSEFTRETQDILDLKKLIYEQLMVEAPFASLHNMFPGISADQHLGTIGEFGKVGKAAQGCNPTAQTGEVALNRKTWTPKQWEIILDTCYNDIAPTIAMYGAKKGIDRFDLTGTDINDIIFNRLKIAIEKMAWRFAWFGDTAAANTDDSPAGNITAGVDTAFYTLFDGFFKQLAVIYAADSNRLTSITKNAQSTYANQTLTDQECFESIEAVYKAAPAALKQAPNQIIYTTGKIAEGYKRHMAKTYSYQFAFDKISNGILDLPYNGITLKGLYIFDEIINADFNTGTAWYKPNRIVYTTKDNLGVGIESANALSGLDSHYDKTTRIWRIEASDKMDAKVIQDNLVQVGI